MTVDQPGLFSVAPAIDNNGRLTFTTAANSNGTATVTVVVQDNGGTGMVDGIGRRPAGAVSNGGVDKSTNTFVINVTPVNDAPVANADSYPLSQDVTFTLPAPGVLLNDTDIENDP